MDAKDIIEHNDDKQYILQAVKENGKFLDLASERFKS